MLKSVIHADRVHVLRRLRDLRDWARFIHDSVREDQAFEAGKRDLLAAYMGDEFLSLFVEDSASLADRLDVMIERIESSARPAERSEICSR